METEWGTKKKVKFIWEIVENGKTVEVHQRFNQTMHEKSALRKAVRAILGRDPGATYDVMKLLGAKVTIIVQHNEHEGTVYANVVAMVRAGGNGNNGNSTPVAAANVHGLNITDDDLPENLRAAGCPILAVLLLPDGDFAGFRIL